LRTHPREPLQQSYQIDSFAAVTRGEEADDDNITGEKAVPEERTAATVAAARRDFFRRE